MTGLCSACSRIQAALLFLLQFLVPFESLMVVACFGVEMGEIELQREKKIANGTFPSYKMLAVLRESISPTHKKAEFC